MATFECCIGVFALSQESNLAGRPGSTLSASRKPHRLAGCRDGHRLPVGDHHDCRRDGCSQTLRAGRLALVSRRARADDRPCANRSATNGRSLRVLSCARRVHCDRVARPDTRTPADRFARDCCRLPRQVLFSSTPDCLRSGRIFARRRDAVAAHGRGDKEQRLCNAHPWETRTSGNLVSTKRFRCTSRPLRSLPQCKISRPIGRCLSIARSPRRSGGTTSHRDRPQRSRTRFTYLSRRRIYRTRSICRGTTRTATCAGTRRVRSVGLRAHGVAVPDACAIIRDRSPVASGRCSWTTAYSFAIASSP